MSVTNQSDQITKLRISAKTRSNYEHCLVRIKKFFTASNIQALNENGNIILPMNLDHIKAFLGNLSKEFQDGTILAHSTVNTYICSIKYYYKENQMIPICEISSYLEEFGNGYKKLVATKKDLGIMKNFEGKVAMDVEIFKNLSLYSLKKINSKESSYNHCIMILCWNMFSRYYYTTIYCYYIYYILLFRNL